MLPRKVGFPEAVARLILAALLVGLVARGLWEALKFGWSILGVAP